MEVTRIAPMVLRFRRCPLRPIDKCRPLHRLPVTAGGSLSSPWNRCASTVPPAQPNGESSKQAQSGTQAAEAQNNAGGSQPPPPRRSLRPYLWASAFAFVGVTISSVMRAIAFPPPLPEPGSEEDEYLVSRYRSDLENLPIVAELRKDRNAWREYDPYSQRETSSSGGEPGDSDAERHMTAGTMRGARGLAVQRSFYNSSERREITVMFFGGGASGWPGITHGGLLATVLKEAVERAASGPGFASDSSGILETKGPRYECESLTLKYKKPTRANNFYVIRAEITGDTADGDVEVTASIENALSGAVGVTATATCRPSSTAAGLAHAANTQAGGLWDGLGSLFSGQPSAT